MSYFVAPPSHLLMQISNSPSLEDFTSSFPHVREEVSAYLEQAGHKFGDFKNILDFGCGVGRFLFSFADQLAADQKLYGCDLNADCANWCKANIKFARIEHTNLRPPLPYSDNSMDLIYALSVFTHLNFDLQIEWAREMHRILRPGGIMMFTTSGMGWLPHPLTMLDYFPYRYFATVGEDGFFSAFSTAATSDIEGQREVASGHSLGALREMFAPLEIVLHHHISRMAGGQSMTIVKKSRSKTILRPDSVQINASNVNLSFSSVDAPSMLRGFISTSMASHGVSKAPIRYTCRGETTSTAQVKLGISSIMGEYHFVPVQIPVPKGSRVEIQMDFSSVPGFKEFHHSCLYN